MQEEDNDTSVANEDTEILNLPLYTERKADGIYRYRRRVPMCVAASAENGNWLFGVPNLSLIHISEPTRPY